MHPAVGEWIVALPGALRRDKRFVCNAAKHDDGSKPGHFLDRRQQKVAAGFDLLRCWLVLWWYTAHGIGDAATDELQAVVGASFEVALGEAEILQRGVEEFAGVIAGERPPSAVGAAQPRCQTDDQKARVDWAK